MGEQTVLVFTNTLSKDVDRCFREFRKAVDHLTAEGVPAALPNYEYHARQLIRTIFAYIEGSTFFLKVKAVQCCLITKRDLTDAERGFAEDIEYFLTDKGTIGERPARIRLADNIRFAFTLLDKAAGLASTFDPSVAWWADLQTSIKIRDRLTHPKRPGDTSVDLKEPLTVLRAYRGFSDRIEFYGEALRQTAATFASGGDFPDGTP